MKIEDSLNEVLMCTSERLADRFYRVLFEEHPRMKEFFRDVNMKHQAAILTMGLQVMVQHYRTPRRSTKDYLHAIGYKHGERRIEDEHYRTFEQVLLDTLADFHGHDWNDALADEWRAATRASVKIMLSASAKT